MNKLATVGLAVGLAGCGAPSRPIEETVQRCALATRSCDADLTRRGANFSGMETLCREGADGAMEVLRDVEGTRLECRVVFSRCNDGSELCPGKPEISLDGLALGQKN